MEDLSKDPPTDINPYNILQIQTTASSGDVKTAYRKLALKHHPDKSQPSARDAALVKFQEIAFAYAILSDERRRKRYDTTGNTTESLDLDDDDFNWSDFFKAQWADTVTGDTLNSFKDTYQNSEEEKRDVLAAYKSAKGDLNKVFKNVMLSNPLDDEDRFRTLIDEAIEAGEVEGYDAYVNEAEQKRTQRHKMAAREGVEAQAYAKKLGVHDQLFGSKKSKAKQNGKVDDEAGLADLIQQRQKGRATTFLDNLEAKYGGAEQADYLKGAGKKRKKFEEPPEELFQRNRPKRSKAPEAETEAEAENDVDDDEEEVVDLDVESPESEDEAAEGHRGTGRTKAKSKTSTARRSKKNGKRKSTRT